jgi:hypothetical protein
MEDEFTFDDAEEFEVIFAFSRKPRKLRKRRAVRKGMSR